MFPAYFLLGKTKNLFVFQFKSIPATAAVFFLSLSLLTFLLFSIMNGDQWFVYTGDFKSGKRLGSAIFSALALAPRAAWIHLRMLLFILTSPKVPTHVKNKTGSCTCLGSLGCPIKYRNVYLKLTRTQGQFNTRHEPVLFLDSLGYRTTYKIISI